VIDTSDKIVNQVNCQLVEMFVSLHWPFCSSLQNNVVKFWASQDVLVCQSVSQFVCLSCRNLRVAWHGVSLSASPFPRELTSQAFPSLWVDQLLSMDETNSFYL